MVKNKKKSISKVIVSQPTSIDTYIDESITLSEQVIVLDPLDNLESAEHTEQVKHAEQHFDNKTEQDIIDIPDIDNKTNDIIDAVGIQIEKSECSILTTKIDDEVIISQPLDNLDSDSLSIEYNIISPDEQNSEIIEIMDMSKLQNNENKIDKTHGDIELTEIKIETNETREKVSPQTKQSNCSRVWCSIL